MEGLDIGEHGISAYPEFYPGTGFTAPALAGAKAPPVASAELARERTR